MRVRVDPPSRIDATIRYDDEMPESTPQFYKGRRQCTVFELTVLTHGGERVSSALLRVDRNGKLSLEYIDEPEVLEIDKPSARTGPTGPSTPIPGSF